MSESDGILRERLQTENAVLREENARLRQQVDALVVENLRLNRRLPIGHLVTDDPFLPEVWPA